MQDKLKFDNTYFKVECAAIRCGLDGYDVICTPWPATVRPHASEGLAHRVLVQDLLHRSWSSETTSKGNPQFRQRAAATSMCCYRHAMLPMGTYGNSLIHLIWVGTLTDSGWELVRCAESKTMMLTTASCLVTCRKASAVLRLAVFLQAVVHNP